ncbi:MAG TPA: metallophosphoesterase family protein [Ktedonobacterales bacterium]|nr:metallophosphoesterase family protein [Ktedonobacterales bacterium]
MRLVILSDIHGNPLALDAVLADIQRQGEIDAYWALGDFAALGYDPVTPLETITSLPHASFTRGNTDRYVVTEDLPVPPKKALEEPALLAQVIEATRSFSWTRGYVSAAGWLDWLTTLPLEVRLTLPDGTRVLGVHAAPGRDDGPGLHPKHSDGELEQRLAGCEAEVVIVGHTHVPMDRRVGGIRAINLGSVSNPVTPGLQATYVLLEADAQGYSIQLRRVEYDREAVIKAIEQARHPTPSFLIGLMRGERITPSDPGFFQAGRRAKNQKKE